MKFFREEGKVDLSEHSFAIKLSLTLYFNFQTKATEYNLI